VVINVAVSKPGRFEETGKLGVFQTGRFEATIAPRADLNRQVVEKSSHRVRHECLIVKKRFLSSGFPVSRHVSRSLYCNASIPLLRSETLLRIRRFGGHRPTSRNAYVRLQRK